MQFVKVVALSLKTTISERAPKIAMLLAYLITGKIFISKKLLVRCCCGLGFLPDLNRTSSFHRIIDSIYLHLFIPRSHPGKSPNETEVVGFECAHGSFFFSTSLRSLYKARVLYACLIYSNELERAYELRKTISKVICLDSEKKKFQSLPGWYFWTRIESSKNSVEVKSVINDYSTLCPHAENVANYLRDALFRGSFGCVSLDDQFLQLVQNKRVAVVVPGAYEIPAEVYNFDIVVTFNYISADFNSYISLNRSDITYINGSQAAHLIDSPNTYHPKKKQVYVFKTQVDISSIQAHPA